MAFPATRRSPSRPTPGPAPSTGCRATPPAGAVLHSSQHTESETHWIKPQAPGAVCTRSASVHPSCHPCGGRA
eukprot:3947020-Prymnesium_polylepis.1